MTNKLPVAMTKFMKMDAASGLGYVQIVIIESRFFRFYVSEPDRQDS